MVGNKKHIKKFGGKISWKVPAWKTNKKVGVKINGSYKNGL